MSHLISEVGDDFLSIIKSDDDAFYEIYSANSLLLVDVNTYLKDSITSSL